MALPSGMANVSKISISVFCLARFVSRSWRTIFGFYSTIRVRLTTPWTPPTHQLLHGKLGHNRLLGLRCRVSAFSMLSWPSTSINARVVALWRASCLPRVLRRVQRIARRQQEREARADKTMDSAVHNQLIKTIRENNRQVQEEARRAYRGFKSRKLSL